MSSLICNVKSEKNKRVNVAYDMSIASNDKTIVSLKSDGDDVGLIAYSECFVEMLYINDYYVGKGIGACLYKFAENEMKKSGCDSIELLAEESGADFWERQGFKEKTKWEGTYPIPMIKFLK